MPDLSIVIPARNEEWLSRTVEDAIANSRADTEVIVVMDGDWIAPQVHDHPKVHIVKTGAVIGQRAATNLGIRLSSATYVMKADAHVSFDVGFDRKLIDADIEIGRPDLTQIPAMVNLHVFNWACVACRHETYQGPKPKACESCKRSDGFERVVIWQPRHAKFATSTRPGEGHLARTEFWRFDHDLHFQYSGPRRPEDKHAELADVMSSVGASFFMRRARFHEIDGLDEGHGSWGGFGTEVACKSWLSGGRHIVNRRTWFAHLFRTQGAEFSFPYPMAGSDQERARQYSRKLWLENRWAKQTRALSWLVEHFAPVIGWHKPEKNDDKTEQRLARLESVRAAGEAFERARRPRAAVKTPTKGIAYYTDNRGDDQILRTVRQQLAHVAPGPIASASLAPLDFGQNVVLPLERGVLTMFRQILAALEALDTDIAFLCEHDVLYSADHFAFTPERRDTFYFNQHRWQLRADDGHAVHYLASQVSGCCADRALLVAHYRARVAHVEQHGFDKNLGYEPGTNRRSREIDPHGAATWFSAVPNIDIRHGFNLSKSKWSIDDFRNKANAAGWTEGDAIPGWGVTAGRVRQFLDDVASKCNEAAA